MITILHLIGAFFFLVCIWVEQAAQNTSSYDIKAERQKEHLKVLGILEDSTEVSFKLTFDFNRPRIRHLDRFSYLLKGRSFDTQSMRQYNGTFCLEGLDATDRVINNSLLFNSGIFPFRVDNVQLIATRDDSVRRVTAFDGILGLNSLDNCNLNVPASAVINQMRGKNKGFSLDIPQLKFVNEFHGQSFGEYDGKWFRIQQFQFGRVALNAPLKGKIDLESRFIKIPSSLYNQIKKSHGLFDTRSLFSSDDTIEFWSDKKDPITFAWMKLDSKSPIFNFPMELFWKRSEKILFPPYWSKKTQWVNTIFIPHDYDFVSFGLFFLDEFKVSFDLENGKIYFERKNVT